MQKSASMMYITLACSDEHMNYIVCFVEASTCYKRYVISACVSNNKDKMVI